MIIIQRLGLHANPPGQRRSAEPFTPLRPFDRAPLGYARDRAGQALLRAGLRISSRGAWAMVRAVTSLRDCIDGLLARATQTQHDAPPVFKPDFIPFDLHQGWAGGCDGEHNFATDDVFFQFDDLCLAFGFALLDANLS